MNEEMRMLLKLTEEVTEYKTFFTMLRTKVEKAEENDRHYMDVDEIRPLVDAFKNKEVNIITFDNCEDKAYEP